MRTYVKTNLPLFQGVKICLHNSRTFMMMLCYSEVYLRKCSEVLANSNHLKKLRVTNATQSYGGECCRFKIVFCKRVFDSFFMMLCYNSESSFKKRSEILEYSNHSKKLRVVNAT